MGCAQSQVDFDGDVDLSHFDLHRVVGKGAFGTVQAVEHRRSKSLYALKYVDKQRCLKAKAVAHIIQERRLLEKINHPYVVNLRFAFQDDANCFFVLDFMAGGNLRYHLNTQGRFSESVVLHWVAELSSALSYLHKQGIIHRDLKPDNILLDSDGHAHVSDFNVAVYSRDLRRMHTSTAGTPAYMAPEMVDGTRGGYSWQIDWWALGVCAHELLWHTRPYEGPSTDAVMRRVRSSEVAPVPPLIPAAQTISSVGCSAITSFLNKDPSHRLGCRSIRSSLEEIQRHPWFASVSWPELPSKRIPPGFVPDQNGPNFDISYEFDAFVTSRKPLAYQKRRATASTSTDPDLTQLEELFTVYDFRAVPSVER
ncbi:kinase-like domain-containing protein [Amylostereum chailletii]|nr:kinase-like domain-containing protein [Amylostereum chailletii]